MTLLPNREPVSGADVTSSVAPSARRTHLHRRPSGAPPPLPRSLGRTGRGWIVAAVVVVAWMLVTLGSEWARRTTEQLDAAVLRAIAEVRTEWLSEIARAIDRAATGWVMSVVAMALIVATIAFRRWRHLFTYLGATIVLQVSGVLLIAAYERPRPYDVTTIGRWQGFALPSAPMAIVSFVVVSVTYALVVPGRPRTIAKAVGTGVVLAVAGSRLYLAVDNPFDVLAGVALGVAIPLAAFRFFTPNEVVPVSYGGGKTAHLDVGGRRGAALRAAVEASSGSRSSTSSPSASPARAARHRCASGWPAIRTRTCSGSSTR